MATLRGKSFVWVSLYPTSEMVGYGPRAEGEAEFGISILRGGNLFMSSQGVNIK